MVTLKIKNNGVEYGVSSIQVIQSDDGREWDIVEHMINVGFCAEIGNPSSNITEHTKYAFLVDDDNEINYLFALKR